MGVFIRSNSGEVLNGNLAIFGGSSTIEDGSTVRGDVIITGGSVDIFGEINGDINTIGGSVNLGDTAVVHGNVTSVGGSVSRAPGAKVEGSIQQEKPNQLNIPGLPRIAQPGALVDRTPGNLWPIGRIFLGFFQVLAMAALAVLLALFLARPTQRIGNAVIIQPILSGAIGLLTVVVAPALLLVLGITLILLPVSLLGFLVLLAALVYGWVGLGLELGHRMMVAMKADWTPPVSAGVGTLVLTFVAWLIWLIPCLGPITVILAASVGLGGVVLTRFGTRPYVPAAPASSALPATPRPNVPTTSPDQRVVNEPVEPPAPPARPAEPESPQEEPPQEPIP